MMRLRIPLQQPGESVLCDQLPHLRDQRGGVAGEIIGGKFGAHEGFDDGVGRDITEPWAYDKQTVNVMERKGNALLRSSA